ncbi:indolepyruvate ferredoxin oxidoreductase alpha subunit [Anaerosphaera aminiphila DSM 21120]|uniref:Indolepyruvate oxidoreductase subunit IorA n=1 Tax=Anaerosphaera aminiphila DSM 21120 TaxID=1120995 RepID=A0A1M5PHE1_9FIRM|nr:indolepyruvate ferredoxin oxidoreductase subunit alpha [Anaerosphaera aminiphila]SHH00889.1 indolepyruvate ferredoxin oxidoreductase alpha subunit [Anaerosphaera aminiphila DSM 21120]
MKNKVTMLGNEAIARGLYEAGVKVSSAYPGTPSTEISEYLSNYKDEIYCEWAPNEKVAVEVAIGASMVGIRSFACMKHVGLNVAADPLYTVSYIGVNGGLVLTVADDPGMYSSQNEQDTRAIARAAHVPVLEPSNSQEAKDMTILAYELSEKYDTPVIIRTTTRLAHSQSIVELNDRVDIKDREYVKNPRKNVMVPANAKARHPVVINRERILSEDACDLSINSIEYSDTSIGVITSGIPYLYVKEALPKASVLKLGLINPLPKKLIEEFAKKVDKLYIIEELDSIIEEQVKSWGIEVIGKDLFPLDGEYSANMIREKILGETLNIEKEMEAPIRPPILCPGCPHRSVFSVMNKLKIHGAGDIGCYTLGAGAPLETIDSTICMGASISSLHGMEKARGSEFVKDWVAVIGDSTFLHTGINSLMNMVYNNSKATVLILDNSITAMTGHQENPATGKTLMGEEVKPIDIKKMCEAMGIKNVIEISSFDLDGLSKTFKEETLRDELSVIIAKAPCVLLKGVAIKNQYIVNKEKCRKCGLCMKPGCPALTKAEDGTTLINDTMCNGCGLCFNLCPFDAIEKVDSVIESI